VVTTGVVSIEVVEVSSLIGIVVFTTVVVVSMFGIVVFTTVVDSSMFGIVDSPGVTSVVVIVSSSVFRPKFSIVYIILID
jgi:hypothetical protein